MRLCHAIAATGLALATTAGAQQFTTAQEVRPILNATRAQWIAVRAYEGRDWLYFSNILAWRCGLSEIHFAVNGGDETQFDAEPCYEGTATPNALKLESVDAIARTYSAGTVATVRIRLVLDDGGEETAEYTRQQIEIE
jgi:hypothetical protein